MPNESVLKYRHAAAGRDRFIFTAAKLSLKVIKCVFDMSIMQSRVFVGAAEERGRLSRSQFFTSS